MYLDNNRLVITSDGLLIPSLALRMNAYKSSPNRVFNLGNVAEKSINDAWNSPIMLISRNSGLGCGTCSVCSNST